MPKRIDFDNLVAAVIQQEGLSALRPVVEKELLHYDILFCLSEAGLLKELTFQGGTSLRLCYGSNRFSEDLDFAGGLGFCSANLSEMKSCIEAYLGGRYGLEVTVKEPKELCMEPEYSEIKVDKWQISVTTAPEQRDIPRQRIKIEVANIPAYTRSVRQLARNYAVLPDGYSDTLISVETLEEVMADKLVSLPASTKYVRYRDIWDLVWLKQQSANVNSALVNKKLTDYKTDNFEEKLQARIDSLAEIISGGKFHEEMKRFIPSHIYDTTLAKKEFSPFLLGTLTELLLQLKEELYGVNNQSTLFKM
ncbi:nucleotidyl transferase AbiEii/AbiGii toxin family protein [Yersinia massiliensis]|uniref:nucleotidyl transferase AbiEii/AbiGii toxin family protein n=1 Tax=Yersinia massiliensis TaxID=419257 RepID=UPI00119F7CC0|nr:nucleotidyl transferase AbiEii/AbiGii toxin family protein [Yersinia massiliensis]MCB5307274.1 nucleotidyl transferase AbiEii/AbiGii toxin family protein [Yersinia massiliensis]